MIAIVPPPDADPKVVPLGNDWFGRMEPRDLLEKALKWPGVTDILILAYDENGRITGGSTMNKVEEILFLIERYKHKMLMGGFATSPGNLGDGA